jgi:hypothetical protein
MRISFEIPLPAMASPAANRPSASHREDRINPVEIDGHRAVRGNVSMDGETH